MRPRMKWKKVLVIIPIAMHMDCAGGLVENVKLLQACK